MRRSSLHSHTRSDSKGKVSIDSTDSRSSVVFNDPFATSPHNGRASDTPTSRPSSRPSTSEDSHSKRSRSSILVQASDALNFRFRRRRKSLRQHPPAPIILPGVMEICAPRRDEEVEERERLRDAAAQSIGLGPDILQSSLSRGGSIDEADEDAEAGLDGDFEMISPPLTFRRSARSSSVSSMPAPGPHLNIRPQTGSLRPSLTHMRTRSTTPASSIPTFPATLSALEPSTVMAAVLPKYYPPPSLRIFALTKQWKTRCLILSSPAPISIRGHTPVSYLHLFKSPALEEREMERLEINEDSVVFVADEDVGGRKGVVKVGGVDIGTSRKETNLEVGGQTMWFLQIADPLDAQRWIAAIKSVILSQRSMRAGLGVSTHPEGNEPKGDMDVMLTMRAQGFISSPTPRRATLPEFSGLRARTTSPFQPVVAPEPTLRSSPMSVRSQARSVSAFKGLFTGSTRPKSPPRSTSANSKLRNTDDSFGAMGDNLLIMTRSNGSGDLTMSPSSHSHPRSASILTGITSRISVPSPIISAADQIVTDRSSVDWSVHADTNRQTPVMSDGSLSPLQPPPHRKTSVSNGPKPSSDGAVVYKHETANGNIAGNFGIGTWPIEEATTPPPTSPTLTSTSIGSPEQRGRAGSMTSVSTAASVELGGPNRWSRQAILPHPLTPPSRPPPAVPDAQSTHDSSPVSKAQIQYPYFRERASSSRSSTNNSPISGASAQPKRESNSSSVSTSTASTTYSRFSIPRRSTSQRRSVPPPPPRPAPTFAPPPPPSSRSSPPPSPVTARPAKSTFRDSIAQQSTMLSLSSPKPPPSSSLPPRPDEKTYHSHRRTSSSDGKSSTTDSHHSIPTFFRKPAGPRYPPPSGPLPPPPPAPSPTPVSRHASIKQRLRILSAPSAAPSIHSFTSSAHATMQCFTPPNPNIDPYAPHPSTPIAAPITMDPNYLSLSSPEPEPEPSPRSPDRPPAPEPFPDSPEITSLSPPPRRGSRQISVIERERLNAETATNKESTVERPVRRGSLSSSVVSLIVAA
ncbi:hypothetical protein PILCRDRAFT_813315 [Piloderma croceum F 1598]|uniref:PH domain-containing protein n=1 Tax=Piloderma croceum (strain F 1598) TaxID=765440 RepID=A0A0C3CHX2_PILCF|nr:hypothetical protein PILCRDRAFT_813315 [Piloderma croceum F 1598]